MIVVVVCKWVIEKFYNPYSYYNKYVGVQRLKGGKKLAFSKMWWRPASKNFDFAAVEHEGGGQAEELQVTTYRQVASAARGRKGGGSIYTMAWLIKDLHMGKEAKSSTHLLSHSSIFIF